MAVFPACSWWNKKGDGVKMWRSESIVLYFDIINWIDLAIDGLKGGTSTERVSSDFRHRVGYGDELQGSAAAENILSDLFHRTGNVDGLQGSATLENTPTKNMDQSGNADGLQGSATHESMRYD